MVLLKQRKFLQEEIHRIREGIETSLNFGVTQPSKSPWAAQLLCVRKKNRTLRLSEDLRKLKSLLVIDSGGQEAMQSVFQNIERKALFHSARSGVRIFSSQVSREGSTRDSFLGLRWGALQIRSPRVWTGTSACRLHPSHLTTYFVSDQELTNTCPTSSLACHGPIPRRTTLTIPSQIITRPQIPLHTQAPEVQSSMVLRLTT